LSFVVLTFLTGEHYNSSLAVVAAMSPRLGRARDRRSAGDCSEEEVSRLGQYEIKRKCGDFYRHDPFMAWGI
jgi:hypothetical protein